LRIVCRAAAVAGWACCAVGVGLCVLWGRSYFARDWFDLGYAEDSSYATSESGHLCWVTVRPLPLAALRFRRLASAPVTTPRQYIDEELRRNRQRLYYTSIDGEQKQTAGASEVQVGGRVLWSRKSLPDDVPADVLVDVQRRTVAHYAVLAPPTLLLGGGLLLAARRLDRDARRVAGQCVRCGYDVRASPERCPECGLEMTTSARTSA